MISDLLFWEKFRPDDIKKMVLLPRIKKFADNGIETNIIMHGNSGVGKTTLARILLKGKNYKKINASLKNGVDVLREELLDFCTSMPSPLIKSDDKKKYVYLEEFDKATSSFQDAFKAFIEEYNSRVRFIITMNHIENIIPELVSRFNVISFDPIDDVERNFLKKGYSKYLNNIRSYIEKKEGKSISRELIPIIVNKHFPDLRSAIQELQGIYITGNESIESVHSDYNFVIDFIKNGKNDPLDNFDFVEKNFYDNPRDLLKVLGRPLIKNIINENSDLFNKIGFVLIKISKEHNESFNNQMVDPVIHLSNYINEIKKVINQ